MTVSRLPLSMMIRFARPSRRSLVLLLSSAALAWAQDNGSGVAAIQQSLEKARVLGSALMIAAHPDDENTAVLAWLAQGRHMRTGYLSLTRGEGGQNLIGSEQGDALGVIRTEELLAARRIDGAEQFFTRAVDFGYSKSAKESFGKWGHDEILSDVVWVIRRFQPDVIILRFSGTSEDGHGHHQASALLGREAYEAAADPKRFPEQLQWVKPWRAKRLVWNAFSFTPEQEKKAQSASNRVVVDLGAYNPVLGRSYAEIAGISRSQHRSQGMGVSLQRGPAPNYFVPVAGDPAHDDLFDGVDTSWGRVPGGQVVGEALARAAQQFSPEQPQAILTLLADAQKHLAGLTNREAPSIVQKREELDELLAACSGLWLDAGADKSAVFPGSPVKITLTVLKRLSSAVRWNEVLITGAGQDIRQTVALDVADNQAATKEATLQVSENQPYSQPFWLAQPRRSDRYVIADQQLIGRAAVLPVFTASFALDIAGAEVQIHRPVHFRYVDHVRGELTRPVEIVPPISVDLPQRSVLFPDQNSHRIIVTVRATRPTVSGIVRLETPPGWTAENAAPRFKLDEPGNQAEIEFTVKPPAEAAPSKTDFRAVASIDGREIATSVRTIDYEHIPPQDLFVPSKGSLRSIDLRVLARSVGYIMGAGDAVPEAIRQMGATVTLLSSQDLYTGDLSRFDAIVTGVRAYNVRQDLRAAQSRLLDYVREGGTLVDQYNVLEYQRFGDKPQQPATIGPYPLEIGRDRVTDEDSPIAILNPQCPLLTTPNQITLDDFKGWIQERGLYFAKKWDPHYSTVLATYDPGEEHLPGGMLYTRYGKGTYIFTGYSWFRQLPAGVIGAYRIFANLLSAGKATAPTLGSSGSAGH